MDQEYIYRASYLQKHAEKIIFLLTLVIASLITGFLCRQATVRAQEKTQAHLAQEVLRFHVLANSDSEEDQALKMQVKEQVLSWLEEQLPEDLDVEETADWIRAHTDMLEELSAQVIEESGFSYAVSAAVTTCYFPEKTYGDITFPAGNYKALRIEIGAAEGQNWWCVLYPDLCFLDAVNAVVPEEGKQKLRQVLTEEEYSQVTAAEDFEIKWYFFG